VLIGVLGAGLITLSARRQRTLSGSGAVAGFIVGVLCTAAGWGWAVLVVALFASANALTRYRRTTRLVRIGDTIEKFGERDAWQVAANGGLFTAAAIGSLIHPSPVWFPLAAGAIAASAADTWATEIGTLADHPPRLITSREVVTPGTSGGVTWVGTFAGLAGATFIAVLALLTGWGLRSALAAVAGGVAGSLIDSLAGATIQRRRWCFLCDKPTERLVHNCGTITSPHGGFGWVNNDVVNAISSLTGAVVGLVLA
jgi:uncharacterized protein (TIGR00297 family)